MAKNMNKNVLWVSALLLIASVPAPAQEQDSAPATSTTRELVEVRLADMKERLNLSDYTWEQVHLILKTSIRERIAIAKKYGLDTENTNLDELSSRDQRRMRRDLKNVRKSTEKRMDRYLDKDQMKEFKAIQEDIHENILARLEERDTA